MIRLVFAPRVELSPAPADNLAAFWRVVAAARALTPRQADVLQDIYEEGWGRRDDRAGRRAYKAACRSGRMPEGYADGSIDAAVDELCGIVGGASSVAVAVLVRDLISGEDFARLTGWWTNAGMPI